jgi:MFS family permease
MGKRAENLIDAVAQSTGTRQMARAKVSALLSIWFVSLSVAAYATVLPFLVVNSGGGAIEISLLAASFSAGAAIFSLVSGSSIRKFGYGWVSAFLIAGSIIACVGFPLVSVLWQMMALRFIMAAAAGYEPVVIAWISELEPENRSANVAALSTSKALGLAMGPLLAVLISFNVEQVDVESRIIVNSAAALLAAGFLCILALLVHDRGTTNQFLFAPAREPTGSFGLSWRHAIAGAGRLLFLRGVMGISNGIVLPIAAIYSIEELGWGISELGGLLGAMTLTLIFARAFLAKRLIDGVGLERVAGCSLALFSLGVLVAQGGGSGNLYFIGGLMMVALANAVLPVVTMVMAANAGGLNRGAIIGMSSAAFFAG